MTLKTELQGILGSGPHPESLATNRLIDYVFDETVKSANNLSDLTDVLAARGNLGTYVDRAAVAAATVPAGIDNIVVEAYSSTAPSKGRANYRAASEGDYAATPALLRQADAAGRKFVINENRLSPAMAGGDPTGVNDSAAAFNAIFAYIRADVTANANNSTRYVIDMAGGKYRVTSSINGTGIAAWNLTITNGVIIGACTGKAVLDLSGTRGYTLSKFLIYGEEANMPLIPVLAARTAASGFCDNNSYEDVSFIGYYSLAADYAYAQETTHRRHCRFWNYNHDAYVAIYQGYDQHVVTSDFQTLLTGGSSYINVEFTNCDWRYLPINRSAAITGITKGATTTVTAAGHPFSNGQEVVFTTVGGMSAINSLGGTVSNVTATTFDVNIDSSAFTNYTSGGLAVRKATQPAVYWCRGMQHRFSNCYIAAYGDDSMHIDWPDGTPHYQTTFDILFEGAVVRSHYRFTPGTSIRNMFDAEFKAYNTHTAGSFFSTDASGSGRVRIDRGLISITNNSYGGAVPVFDDEAKYTLYAGVDIYVPTRSQVDAANLTAFHGSLAAQNDGKKTLWTNDYDWDGNGSYTPTVSSSLGTITTASATGYFKRVIGDIAHLDVTITITTNGTGSGCVSVTLPAGVTVNADGYAHLSGRATNVSGKGLIAQAPSGANTFEVRNYDNSYPGASGEVLWLSGIIRVAA